MTIFKKYFDNYINESNSVVKVKNFNPVLIRDMKYITIKDLKSNKVYNVIKRVYTHLKTIEYEVDKGSNIKLNKNDEIEIIS